jgi:predicted GNAT family N-acyltransferase
VARGPADLRIEPLARTHERAGFNSGAEELDRYLKDQAGQDARRRVGAVFVASAAERVVGYYTLSAAALELADLPEELARRLPRYPHIPATLLGRLAVDLSWRGTRLGERLLVDALLRSLRSEIASYAVVVDARDEAAASFYRRYGFLALKRSDRRLFIPMATVAALPPR